LIDLGPGGCHQPGGGPLQDVSGEAALHQPALRPLLRPVPDQHPLPGGGKPRLPPQLGEAYQLFQAPQICRNYQV